MIYTAFPAFWELGGGGEGRALSSISSKLYHHSFRGAVDTQSRQTRPQRRQTSNLLRAALADLKSDERDKKLSFQFISN